MKRMLNIRVMALMLLLLTGGAIVNVAVAWGCCYFVPCRTLINAPALPAESNDQAWLKSRTGRWAGMSQTGDWIGITLESRSSVVDVYELSLCRGTGLAFNPLGVRTCAGWPMRCFDGGRFNHRLLDMPRRANLVNAIGTGKYPVVPTHIASDIPLRPLWPGFAINTIFYAAILALLFFAPSRIRRFIRIKRHRCPACGYKIAQGVGAVCSECGTPLPRSLVNESASSAQTNSPP